MLNATMGLRSKRVDETMGRKSNPVCRAIAQRRTDTVSVAERSRIMGAVRSSGNRATEMVLVKRMRKHGITGWRRRVDLRGKPDFVFVTERVAIFVDGCFWHGCPKHCRMPKGNRSYWQTKIASNTARDALVTRTLRRAGSRSQLGTVIRYIENQQKHHAKKSFLDEYTALFNKFEVEYEQRYTFKPIDE